ncbi:hypothetical protein F2Q70_00005617 [Brassica cretica]|uniref:Uncharacterized protein n=2 Tax=Brassica cretica TaxID=69181 RepID=A0A3N6TM01_BRACR|nr:hypothetical protein F2Q68_00022180 [Brassica cretica]KAF2572303.1 hypothetical protein F2Q70_00005617 [Brassica cretica]KAF3528465.1 hypothetical protein DY000_02037676 [Brassica cretica]
MTDIVPNVSNATDSRQLGGASYTNPSSTSPVMCHRRRAMRPSASPKLSSPLSSHELESESPELHLYGVVVA